MENVDVGARGSGRSGSGCGWNTYRSMVMVRMKMQADTAEELDKKVDEYLTRFNPWGYGTREVERGVDSVGFYAVLTRSDSCD